jgi:hypothetical protein
MDLNDDDDLKYKLGEAFDNFDKLQDISDCLYDIRFILKSMLESMREDEYEIHIEPSVPIND